MPAERGEQGAVSIELEQATPASAIGVAHRRAVPLGGHDADARREIRDVSRLAFEPAEKARRPAGVHEAE